MEVIGAFLSEVSEEILRKPGEKTLDLIGNARRNDYIQRRPHATVPTVVILNRGDTQVLGSTRASRQSANPKPSAASIIHCPSVSGWSVWCSDGEGTGSVADDEGRC